VNLDVQFGLQEHHGASNRFQSDLKSPDIWETTASYERAGGKHGHPRDDVNKVVSGSSSTPQTTWSTSIRCDPTARGASDYPP
jgi:hypothetical protein